MYMESIICINDSKQLLNLKGEEEVPTNAKLYKSINTIFDGKQCVPEKKIVCNI